MRILLCHMRYQNEDIKASDPKLGILNHSTMDHITNTINTYVSPLLTNGQGTRLVQQHRTSITAAVALISSYAIFRSITKVPRQLEHLPHLGFFDYMKAIVTGKSMDDIAHKLTIPAAMQSKGGLYVVSCSFCTVY